MSDPSSEAQQACIHMKWGWLPVLMIRKSYPLDGYGYEWGKWRKARLGEVACINALLLKTWKD